MDWETAQPDLQVKKVDPNHRIGSSLKSIESTIARSAVITLSLLAETSVVCRDNLKFANGLDKDQDRRSVGPDLHPNRLTF